MLYCIVGAVVGSILGSLAGSYGADALVIHIKERMNKAKHQKELRCWAAELMGLPENPCEEMWRRRYKVLIALAHPDKNPETAEQLSRDLNKAKNYLEDRFD